MDDEIGLSITHGHPCCGFIPSPFRMRLRISLGVSGWMFFHESLINLCLCPAATFNGPISFKNHRRLSSNFCSVTVLPHWLPSRCSQSLNPNFHKTARWIKTCKCPRDRPGLTSSFRQNATALSNHHSPMPCPCSRVPQ